jgi:hypothetical protein
MGNQRYIVSGKVCPICGGNIEYSNFGDEEIERCIECDYVITGA